MKEMQSLGLNVEVISETGESVEVKETEEDEDIIAQARRLGLDLKGKVEVGVGREDTTSE
jgi:hypothetical protein